MPPTLLELLFKAFCEEGGEGDRTVTEFMTFSEEYLTKHRPVGVSHSEDANCIIRLTNNEQFAVCTHRADGKLPDSGAISVVGDQNR